MEKTVKNKLVRDKIPQIIKSQNYTCEYHLLTDIEYVKELKAKIIEEAKELSEDYNLEELADVYEVMLAIANNLGYSLKDIEEKANFKRQRKGSFHNKVFLESYQKNTDK